ncbi:hypothetical protein Nepgr_004296 [Nepenthes gracilis]|uniref:Fungal lipase-type domain-containing protein n=1 Tax=Nepenthes gracilis TaxID=150966 RepID=A0AAD3XEZ9_NEPGR|nr:hypothetical protein Nepgr_004296 [Nepenthes gracilis]
MEAIQRRVESWIRDQRSKLLAVPSLWPQIQWPGIKWPPWPNDRGQRKKLQEEYERRRKQLDDLRRAVKAESVADLQDILACMVLSECVYKRPASELIRAVNKFKADFGGQVVSLERVQPSLDHVPHRYLLAEAGDTLFASFMGTKQYKDVMADVNIFQGAIFHDDDVEDIVETEIAESDIIDSQQRNVEKITGTPETKHKQRRQKLKPAAHRGFMARAKGIPALELYRLAQKKKKKLVLCGHSLGGAVAALSTLAILRVIAPSSPSKENEKFQVKCITFSQPPVGNAALRDYVNRKGWQHYFKTYCIPEDLVPRILSPAYFHHYNVQTNLLPVNGETTSLSVPKQGEVVEKSPAEKLKENGEQLVLGVGPIQTSIWRFSRLVPLEGVRRHLAKVRGNRVSLDASSVPVSSATTSVDDKGALQSLEIQEGSDGVSLKPIVESDKRLSDSEAMVKPPEKSSNNAGDSRAWRRVPYLPSYVPFGQLYLLGTSSVESLSDSEYSKLTSVKSVIDELRERFQSHSMRSYRSRFQRIFDLCMCDDASSFIAMDQLQQFPRLHQWLGLSVAGNVEIGHIVESPSIRTATSIVPLGWNGSTGDKNAEFLKVDITGFRLHLCTLVQAQVNGNWCSTTVESFPSEPKESSDGGVQAELQKIRVLIGAPLRRPPKHQVAADSLMAMFPSIGTDSGTLERDAILGSLSESKFLRPGGLSNVLIYCTSDFATACRVVDVRTRRVRLVGLEGAGKTSLLKAILNQSRPSTATGSEILLPEADVEEGIAGGLCYMDSAGVNLQELNLETSRFRDELWMGIRDLSRKIDLIVLVHNLAHKIPLYSNSNASQQWPALSVILDEAKALGVPWVLAITNKFSVSAHQQKEAIDTIMRAYQASPSNTEILNSCPYYVHTAGSIPFSSGGTKEVPDAKMSSQNLILGPLNLIRRPFQRKANILPVEGVISFCQLVHRVLQSKEDNSFQEFAEDRLLLEVARDRAAEADAIREAREKANSMSSAAVGASIGAGIGIVLAVVMGAASALRKP